MKRLAFLFTVVSLIALLLTGCTGQTAKKTETASKGNEVSAALYKGGDRSAKIENGAKNEGKLMIYEGMSKQDLNALVQGFNKKYPFIKVETYRGNSDAVLQKIMSESSAGKMIADVIGLSEIPAEILIKENLVQPYYSPETGNLGANLKDSKGFWTMYRQQFYVAGYNTNLVKDPPKTYEDFLDPKWKGKVGLEINSPKWMATLTKSWGEEKGLDYFKKLSQQDLIVRDGLSLMSQLVSAGEIPMTITVLNHEIEKNKKSGAPVEWIPLEPVVSTSAKALLPKGSAHPNAALLWIDFILSKEGQTIMAGLNRIPARDDIPLDPPRLKKGFKYINVDTKEMVDNSVKWQDLFNGLFVNKGK